MSENILLIKLDRIGDFILWLPYAGIYRKKYPEANISLVCNSALKEFAESFSFWDNVIGIDINKCTKNNPRYIVSSLRKIRSIDPSITINPVFSRTFYQDLAVLFSGAKQKIGFKGDKVNFKKSLIPMITNCFYTRFADKDDFLTDAHEIAKNAFFANFFQDKFSAGSVALLGMQKINTPDNYCLIFPDSSVSFKNRGLDFFKKIGDRLLSDYSLNCIFCSGKPIDNNKIAPHINLTGKTSLQELAYLTNNALFVITNDTCVVHMSAIQNTPSICLVGGGHFERFLPYPKGTLNGIKEPITIFKKMDCFNCNWKCIYWRDKNQPEETVPCIKNISFEDVWEKIKKIMS